MLKGETPTTTITFAHVLQYTIDTAQSLNKRIFSACE